jgi:hypothetical protein
MIKPTNKSQGIDDFLTEFTGRDRRATILARKCCTCEGDAEEFRNRLSEREYAISGMCQKCQDSVFGVD